MSQGSRLLGSSWSGRRGWGLLPVLCLLSNITPSLSLHAQDWPQFLGPDRTGVTSASQLIQDWPSGGPEVRWRTPLGVGMSGVAVAGGRAVTLFQDAQQQYVVAIEVESGRELWRTALSPAYRNSMGDGPRSTPTIAMSTVYAYSGDGVLGCLNVETGEIRWKVNSIKLLDGQVADYGMASSPLVVGGTVIVTVGGSKGALAAFDIASGRLRWQSGPDRAGYSSPVLLTLADHRYVIAFGGDSLVGVSPETGEVRWTYPFATDYDCNIACPIVMNDKIFISAGENHGCALLKITPGDAQDRVTEVWTSTGPKSVMRNEWQTSLLIGDRVYGLDNVGSAGPVTHLNCIDPVEGRLLWQQKRFGKANLVAAGKLLLGTTMKGEFVMLRANPDRFEELGRKTVLRTTRQAPSIAAGCAFLRDDQEMVCLDLRAKE